MALLLKSISVGAGGGLWGLSGWVVRQHVGVVRGVVHHSCNQASRQVAALHPAGYMMIEEKMIERELEVSLNVM
jgi:hypothetical protein